MPQLRRISLLLLLVWIMPVLATEYPTPVRIALTSVAVTGDQSYLQRLDRYLEQKIGQSVELQFFNSCRKIMDSLQGGHVDFAWIGGYCFVRAMDRGYLELMMVPIYRGKPYHRSLIIVHQDSSLREMSDLRGRIFAFSDPDSNTGFAYPLTLIPRGERRPETFFREAFFTFSHVKTVQAVAEQVADGGAVDSYTWEYLASLRPEITKKTRIIKRSSNFGFPPVGFRIGVEIETVERMREVFKTMHNDSVGKSILAELKLDEFRQYPPSLFNSTRKIVNAVRTRDSWVTSAVID